MEAKEHHLMTGFMRLHEHLA